MNRSLNTTYFYFISVCAVLLFTLSITSQVQARTVLRLATQDLPPYQMIVRDVKTGEPSIQGMAVDRIRCVLDRMNFPYEIILTNWSEAQLGAETGKYDGFFVGSKNPSRSMYSKSSLPIIVEDLAWFMPRHTQVDPNSPKNKIRKRYGAKFATSKWQYLMRNGFNTVMRPQNGNSLLKMLILGDIDVALEYELIFEYYMKLRNISKEYFLKIPFKKQALSVHFSNDFLDINPNYLNQFNENIKLCKTEK